MLLNYIYQAWKTNDSRFLALLTIFIIIGIAYSFRSSRDQAKVKSRNQLKQKYQNFYDRINALNSSCLDLKITDVMMQLKVEDPTENFISIIAQLKTIDKNKFKHGLLLHDYSGIGLYSLAYYLAKCWADGEIF